MLGCHEKRRENGAKTWLQTADGRRARKVETLSVADALIKLGDPGVVFIDIRESKELEREGSIPGAFHAPRGMLEFWVDPDSPYHKEIFSYGLRLTRQSSPRK